MSARDELAKLLFVADNSGAAEPEHEWEMTSRHNPAYAEYAYMLADAILAAGYRRTDPKWAETLTNDGTYEYTVSSDCDGSNVTYWRRTPGKLCIEDAGAWEAYEPEADL